MQLRNLSDLMKLEGVPDNLITQLSLAELISVCSINKELSASMQKKLDIWLKSSPAILMHLSHLSVKGMHEFVQKFFRRANNTYLHALHDRVVQKQDATLADIICYAIVTDNIHTLTIEQLEWTHEELAAENTVYEFSQQCIKGILALLKDLHCQDLTSRTHFRDFLLQIGEADHYLNFSSANLDHINFYLIPNKWQVKANLAYANFNNAYFNNTQLNNINLTHAQFNQATISWPANDPWRHTFHYSVDLSNACLRGANLQNTRGWYAVNLHHADLTGANLTNTDLFSAHECYELITLTNKPWDLWGTLSTAPLGIETACLQNVKFLPSCALQSSDALREALNAFKHCIRGTPTYHYMEKLAPSEIFDILRKGVAADLIQSIDKLDLSPSLKLDLLQTAASHSFFNLPFKQAKSTVLSLFGKQQAETAYQMIMQAIQNLSQDAINKTKYSRK